MADDKSETLIMHGGAVKALDDNRLGGYLVLFGSPDMLDTDGEFFDKATDYGIDDKATSAVIWNHGSDPIMKRRRVGKATIGLDDVGVWIEAQLHMRDDYEKAIMQLAKQGKLGWSSGTASHLVEYAQQDKAVHIAAWPLGLDASLTPTPADPRNHVTPLKSMTTMALADMLPEAEGSQPPAATKTAPVVDSNTSAISEVHTMSDSTITLTEDQLKAIVSQAVTDGVDKAVKAMPAPAEPVATNLHDRAEDKPWANFGEFLIAVKGFYTSERQNVDKRLLATIKGPTGYNEAVDSAGGFLVDKQVSDLWIQRMYEQGAVLSRVAKEPIGAGFNGTTWKGLDETSRALGSRWGGIRAYWANEAASMSGLSSTAKFTKKMLSLEKIFSLYYATDEELQDAANLTARVDTYVRNELAFVVEYAVIANGSGAGQPLAVLNSPALVSVAKETGQAAATLVYNNLIKMWARMWGPSRRNAVWFINQDVEPQLDVMYQPVGTSGIPPNFVTYGPDGVMRIKGAPVIPVEYCSTLGTVGDVILADLSQYKFIAKGDVQTAASIHVNFLTDETAFRFTWRCNGTPLWTSALTPLNGSSNTLSPYVALATRA